VICLLLILESEHFLLLNGVDMHWTSSGQNI
jgi:hypothetical protein